MSPPWLARLRPGLARLRGSGVVVAVSGGGDSVGLLRALMELRAEFDLRLSVAHLDHGTRGEEGRGDARFVMDLAEALGLPIDLGHWQSTRTGHFEADARRARYEWLTGVATARNCAGVAVGQTLDDQAETILHRVIRGTGLRGLAGMPARRALAPGVILIRPLLGVTRLEVRDYLAAIGQGFREDSTNLDTSRTRARIRLELRPKLAEDFNPNVDRALVNLGRIASGANRAMEKIASARLAGLTLESRSDHITFDRPALAKLGRAGRIEILRLAWRRLGWPEQEMDAGRWRRLTDLGWSRLSVGAGVEAEATADRLTLRRSMEPPRSIAREPVALPVPGWADWGGWRIETTLGPAGPRDESVDLDALVLPLMIRQGQPGDRFEPLGLEGKSQPLNDFFRGRRVPRGDRSSVPIVCDQGGIVWVVGHRIADRARLTDATRRTLGLRFEPAAPSVQDRRFSN
jgi:tRNA(Ile)-lysidine synthase